MKTLQLIFLLMYVSLSMAQIKVVPLNDVHESFKKKYYSQKRDYNPLQVGNVWQYRGGESNSFLTTRIVQDSVINGKKYFKKISYQNYLPTTNFVSWERNDTVSGVSFMLDFEDVNNNGDFLEELPLDSLENPYWSRYLTYKYSFAQPNPFSFFPGQKTVLVKDTSWVKLEGDTVISRYFEILELFWGEHIIEKFGVFDFNLESPSSYCTGAIINGKKYGTIVSVEDEEINHSIPSDFFLENNFPNPFNPTTTINFKIPNKLNGNQYYHVKLIVSDPLGRKIITLVDEKKAGGNYSVTFNAQELSSGVYFYKITANNYSEVKKMILLK
ncbi:MAG: T9SS type A sorting domain-containing protein [Ignavibacteriales bacterium]|nr:T9SS type A sorting domain-containing protein [Ignavibacteriales bacterium]